MKIVILLLISIVSFSAELDDYERGTYIGVGYGIANYRDGGRLRSVENLDNGVYRINAGAYVSDAFSVEILYHHFIAFDGRTKTGVPVTEQFSVLGIAVLGHYALIEDVDVFARFGAGQLFWKEAGAQAGRSDAATLIGGVGLGYKPLKWLRISGGYDFFSFGMDDNATRYDMQLGAPYLQMEVLF